MLTNRTNIGTNEILSSSGIIAKAVAGGGMIFCGFGLFLLLLFLPTSWIEQYELMMKVVSFSLLLIGVILVVWSIVSIKHFKQELLEKRTLKIAAKHNGVITAGQLALDAKINVSNADMLLRKLQLKGVAEIAANEHGAVCFKFHDLMT